MAMNLDLPIDLDAYNDLVRTEAANSKAENERAASAMLAELNTRVTTHWLHPRSGDEETAVKSAREVISGTRSILQEFTAGRRFEIVAVAILNHIIRPHTDRWTGWSARGAFQDDDRRRKFRAELGDLQDALKRAVLLLEAVREGRKLRPDDLFMGGVRIWDGRPSIRSRRALERVTAGIKEVVGLSIPDRLFESEEKEIVDRRGKNESELNNAVGLALSGGGIRSATFALGVAQVLARRGVLARTDYLSTVSGGGYLGSFLSCCLNESPQSGGAPGDHAETVRVHEQLLGGKTGTDTTAVRFLRNRSKYLLEGGPLPAILTLALGIVTNLVALLPSIVLLAFAAYVVRQHTGFWSQAGEWTLPSPGALVEFLAANPLASAGTVIGAVLVLMLLGKVSAGWAWRVRYTLTLLAPATVTAAGLLIIISDSPVRPATPAVAVFYWLLGSALVAQLLFRPIWSLSTRGADPETPGRQFRDRVEAATLYLTAAAGAGAVVAAVPLLWDGYAALSASIDLSWPTAGIALAATLVSAVIAKWLLSDEALETLIGAALTAAPLLFFLLLFLAASISFSSATPAAVVALVVVAPPFLWYFMDLNALSLHGFYRRQLAKCYLIRQAAGSEMKEVGKLRLSALGSRAPYHLVNATVNLPGSGNKGLRGRKGDFFLFSKRHCGSPTTGYVRTETLEDLDPALDLGSAMAISGAAFSSNMAVLELDHLRFFLTLLNVRLGYWIPNAENLGWIVETARKLFRGHRCTPGPGFLRHEMFGTMDESHSFLNLSDGGHIENLGVYELLRRKCKFVIAVDGECDETRVFDAVVKLTRYARIDLGAEVTVDLRELTVDDNGLSRSHAALGKITYADQSIGWLLYLKPSLTGNEPLDLLDYRREQPAFPHESTLDQLYSEKQFEAYRALGEHTANELFRSDILRPKGRDFEAHSSRGNTDINKWYEALAMNMLPDNDEVFKADPTNLTDLRVNIAISRSDKADLEEINRVTTEFCEKLISLAGCEQ